MWILKMWYLCAEFRFLFIWYEDCSYIYGTLNVTEFSAHTGKIQISLVHNILFE